ncbi:glycosyltransferase family 17 protein [Apodospora peruviana]|uniref:Glycosyltransferase family 17 protein n=1 Tax=Apodospora peruviana TaxID=516989 RepID=A0AAE0MEK7_9PEZI|nr:glycosyltransferase family 17 protein [Apodospora peruviana]
MRMISRTLRRHPIRIALVVGSLWMLVDMLTGLRDLAPLAISNNPSSALEQAEQRSLCQQHGWKPFHSTTWMGRPAPRRKVYDLVMVNTELDWLEIRLNTTWNAVDYFVLVEGHRTFTSLDKPLVLKENMAKFESRYGSKIIYHEIEYPPNFNPQRTWDTEDLQRNAMYTQVFPHLAGEQAPRFGDVIVVSDIDEIPRPETLEVLRACRFPRRLTLRSAFYYYSFQYLHRGEEWPHPQATYYQGFWRTVKPNDLRVGLGFPLTSWWDSAELPSAAWHCSSCFGTMEELLTKMRSFAHVWMNAEEYRNKKRIADRVRRGKDIWDRTGQIYDRVENNTDVPRFLLENPERFPYALNRDGPTAGFTDYAGE